MLPSRMSGGRYHRVTTSLEYVLVGMDLARARPGTDGTVQNETDLDQNENTLYISN